MHQPSLDVAIIGAGIAGVVHLHYARQAGLKALVLERQDGAGGLWRQLPAWQDIQIGTLDWAVGDIPLAGPMQPQVLANIEDWIERFGLADGIRLSSPLLKARETPAGWELHTPQGIVRARHLIAATGAHNTPLVPAIRRQGSEVRELHSSQLRDPRELTGRDVLVVGGGASAFDLLDLCLEHGARRITWVYRGLRWFLPTGKPKSMTGSARPFARMQASRMSAPQQSSAIGGDMRARYAKFGLQDILPQQDWNVERDQIIPGRQRMLANFHSLERYRGSIESIEGRTVRLTGGEQIGAELLLWGTGYELDLTYFESASLAAIRSLRDLVSRCGCIFRSLDAANLYFPAVFLDGIGSAPWSNVLLAQTIMSHIQGTARLDLAPVHRNVNHFELVDYLAPRDPGTYPDAASRERYWDMALNTPDDQPYPIP